MRQNYQITNWCRQFIHQHVCAGDICVDATAGNGHDTQFLCELVGDTGKVYAFDIQEIAIDSTRERLKKAGLEAECIVASHEDMKEYVTEVGQVACIMFNFGYLPGGDHSIATRGKTSIQAIEVGLDLLKSGGIMSLCIYSGGDSGFEEKDGILEFIKTLDAKRYIVIVSEYYNRPNHPPIPVQIIKL